MAPGVNRRDRPAGRDGQGSWARVSVAHCAHAVAASPGVARRTGRLRQALQHAINRTQIIDTVYPMHPPQDDTALIAAGRRTLGQHAR